MTGVEVVHPVGAEAVEGWSKSFMTTLLLDVHSADFDARLANRRLSWNAERTWGARDRGRWVASLATVERSVTVPGTGGIGTNDITVDALTAVTVAGTHRRRGLLTQMLSDSLRAAKERGDAISVLIAAEWAIYGRFGYAPATVGANYRYHPRRRGAAPRDVGAGTVREVDAAEMFTIAPTVFAAARALRAGQIDRRPPWPSRNLGLDGFALTQDEKANLIVHEGSDGPDGTLAWRTTRGFDVTAGLGEVHVLDLVATNDTAYRDLWGYLSGLDAVERIELHRRPVDEPIRWLLDDGRALEQTASYDFMWVRLLDVPAALSARGYAVPGDVVLEVVDDDTGGYAAGRYRLTATAQSADCGPTDAPADLRLSQRTLASIYLGGHRLGQRAILGDTEELTPGAMARVDLMFATALPPWTQTGF